MHPEVHIARYININSHWLFHDLAVYYYKRGYEFLYIQNHLLSAP